MKISEIRDTIRAANWSRQYNTGGTRDENRRCDLPSELLPHLAKLEDLQINSRFAIDISNRAHAIFAIGMTLARWQRNQAPFLFSVR